MTKYCSVGYFFSRRRLFGVLVVTCASLAISSHALWRGRAFLGAPASRRHAREARNNVDVGKTPPASARAGLLPGRRVHRHNENRCRFATYETPGEPPWPQAGFRSWTARAPAARTRRVSHVSEPGQRIDTVPGVPNDGNRRGFSAPWTVKRAVRKPSAQDARESMEAQIVANPAGAPIAPGTGGVRKLRRAGSGRGKRGGIRTICYYRADPAAVCLPMACATANREGMKPADRKGQSRLAAEIRRDEAK